MINIRTNFQKFNLSFNPAFNVTSMRPLHRLQKPALSGIPGELLAEVRSNFTVNQLTVDLKLNMIRTSRFSCSSSNSSVLRGYRRRAEKLSRASRSRSSRKKQIKRSKYKSVIQGKQNKAKHKV